MAVDPEKQAILLRKLELLREGFIAQLPARMEAIADEWKGFLDSGDHQHLVTVHRLVHSLTGTAGTFGLQVLSEFSRDIERQLKAMVNGSLAIDDDIRSDVSRQLERLYGIRISGDPGGDRADEALLSDSAPGQRLSTVLFYSADRTLVSSLSSQLAHFGYRLRMIESLGALDEADTMASAVALVVDAEKACGDTDEAGRMVAVRPETDRSIPLVVIDRAGGFHERLRAVRSGSEAFLVKPFDVTDLVDHLDRLTVRMDEDPYRILLVEDDPDLAERYRLLLEAEGMVARSVSDPLEVMPRLAELKPDLVLMDLYMPACNGAELARVIRQQPAYVSLPIVFLSSERDHDKQFAAMSLGGDDFLTKPIDDRYLVKALSNRAARSRLLHSLISRDSLTGLLKHTRIKEVLEAEVSRARRNGSSLTFAMLDIDHFKQVNDRYGHLAGDHIIKSLSHLLRQRLRKSDVVGRYGGEEFAVIMPDTQEAEARRVLDSIRKGFARIRHHWHDVAIHCSFSGGVAELRGYPDGESLTRAADEALYRAKEAGRDRIETA